MELLPLTSAQRNKKQDYTRCFSLFTIFAEAQQRATEIFYKGILFFLYFLKRIQVLGHGNGE